jgi:hypothetical protein
MMPGPKEFNVPLLNATEPPNIPGKEHLLQNIQSIVAIVYEVNAAPLGSNG